ncbi:hypothetical protein GCM10017581_100890 [Dactylosporangium matsuzakiense]|uniref:Uncharacterized protein n=1 Tax=Dactylosporangium matsuzakiense TaxID=53360 RepID=A0A9W6KVZ7_9ACTN|nr:hypothetical protein GCM10017581_100890 [Dactylosporangium matsuzakiense]
MGVTTNLPPREPHSPTPDPHDRPGDERRRPDPDTPHRPAAQQDPSRDLRNLTTTEHGDPLTLSNLIASGDIDVVPGGPPVPIAVWRVADADGRWGHHQADALSPRLAALLVGVHTRPGDTIVSIGDDPALAGAAGAGGRVYRSVSRADDLASLDHVAGTVALIVLPWPPAHQTGTISRQSLVGMFTVCRRLMNPGGCTIVALAALPPGQTFVQHSGGLIPAAHTAGLGWLQHIVAITAPIVGQHITWKAAPANPAMLRAAAHLRVQLDLFVFTIRGGRTD